MKIIPVKTKYGKIKFYCNSKQTTKRAKKFLISEPETRDWIDSFKKGDIFWDIGSCIGHYAIYASMRSKIKSLAFEPSAFNYYVLNHNIKINKLEDRILAFCVAFNDKAILDYFYLFSSQSGTSHHNFGEPVGYKGDSFKPKFRQGMISYTIDSFIEQFNPDFPTHIKIDVDGLEDNILDGAINTLKDKRLKSVLVELDTNQKKRYKHILKTFKEAGMKHLPLYPKKPRKKPVTDGSDLIWNFIFVKEK